MILIAALIGGAACGLALILVAWLGVPRIMREDSKEWDPVTDLRATKPDSLAKALLAFQAERPVIGKTATNPHFKSRFAPLDEVLDKVIPALNAVGIVVTQKPVSGGTLVTRLIHAETGEADEAETDLLMTKSDPQGQGSAITYARRYALLAMLGLAPDDDDDGEANRNGRTSQARVTPQVTAQPPKPTVRLASQEQRRLIFAKWKDAGGTDLDALKVIVEEETGQSSTERIPAAKVDAILKAIEEWGLVNA